MLLTPEVETGLAEVVVDYLDG